MGKVKINLKGISLDSEEKRILSYLGGNYEESMGLNDILDYLKDMGYEGVTRKNVLEKLDYLSDVGYIRSKTAGKGENREEKFYLSSYLGGGTRARRGVQGRGIINDLERFVKRVSGTSFLIFGLGILIYEGLNITGAVISNGKGIGISSLLGFALIVIGGILIKKN